MSVIVELEKAATGLRASAAAKERAERSAWGLFGHRHHDELVALMDEQSIPAARGTAEWDAERTRRRCDALFELDRRYPGELSSILTDEFQVGSMTKAVS